MLAPLHRRSLGLIVTDLLRSDDRPIGRSCRPLFARWLTLLMLLALCACSGGEIGIPLALELEMVPAGGDLPKGLTRSFTVFGTIAGEPRVDFSGLVHWQSSAPEVASIDADGLVRARAEGSTVITASCDEAGVFLQTSAELRVTPPVVQSMTVAPDPAVSGVGLQLKLKATGTYSDGTIADVTSLAVWTSQSPAVVDVQPTTGISMGIALGTGTIRVAIGAAVTTVGYSVVTNTWTSGGDQPGRLIGATMLADGRVLSVGQMGYDPAAVYDVASRSWSKADPYLECSGCSGGVLTLLSSGLVLGTGGTSFDKRNVSLSTSRLFDPASGRWDGGARMTQPRHGHSAIRLASGAVLVVGGIANWDPLTPEPKTAEIFDPASVTWSRTGDFGTPAGAGQLSLLPDGKVLMISGRYAELYDPAAGTWSWTGSPSGPSGTVTPLRGGKVLKSGGGTTEGGDVGQCRGLRSVDRDLGSNGQHGAPSVRSCGHAAGRRQSHGQRWPRRHGSAGEHRDLRSGFRHLEQRPTPAKRAVSPPCNASAQRRGSRGGRNQRASDDQPEVGRVVLVRVRPCPWEKWRKR